MTNISIYTDGACSGNPGKGGCAWLAFDDKGNELVRGNKGVRHTTNNRMEIAAANNALEQLFGHFNHYGCKDTDIKVTVYSDSQLLVNTMSNGWAKKTNNDLWRRLDDAIFDLTSGYGIKVTFSKVKGHSDDKYNNEVDRMAVEAYNAPADKLYKDAIYENIHSYREVVPKLTKNRYTVAVTLPLTLWVPDIEATTKEEALAKAKETALKTPYEDWGDDVSTMQFDIVR